MDYGIAVFEPPPSETPSSSENKIFMLSGARSAWGLQRSSKSQNTKSPKQMPGQTARRPVFELGVWNFEVLAWALPPVDRDGSLTRLVAPSATGPPGIYQARVEWRSGEDYETKFRMPAKTACLPGYRGAGVGD